MLWKMLTTTRRCRLGMWCALLVFLAANSFACTGGRRGGAPAVGVDAAAGTGPATIALEDLCREMAVAFCAVNAGCCSQPYADESQCVLEQRTVCEEFDLQFGELISGVETGTVSYDGRRAASAIRQAQTAAETCAVIPFVSDALGSFSGSLGEGEFCGTDEACAAPLSCWGFVCSTPPGPGENCDERCGPGAICLGGTCSAQPDRASGAPCDTSSDCDGRCDSGVCRSHNSNDVWCAVDAGNFAFGAL